MAYGLTVRRGGACNRLAEPHWVDPLDTSFSKQHGGRWNAPGSYGVLYLNMTEHMARIQVEHRLAGHPYDVEDLDPANHGNGGLSWPHRGGGKASQRRNR